MASLKQRCDDDNIGSITKGIKALVESRDVRSVPSEYTFIRNPNEDHEADLNDPDHSIPIIDFSLLTSDSPQQRSKILHDLQKACQEWGFFLLINHGVGESLMKRMIEMCRDFFNMPAEEKPEIISNNKGAKRSVLEPIMYGTSFNVAIDKVLLWRDFIKVISHPHFNSPHKPQGFRETALEFSTRTREVASKVVKAISETLGLEEDCISKAMNWDEGLQLLAANYYPACPEPDRAIGIPPHTDHGLVTLLIQNEMSGLQVQHKGQWVMLEAITNAFVVNLGDQMQVVTNGKYKSVRHRAVVNNTKTRISIAVPHGPSVDKVVVPLPELLEKEGQSPVYSGMSYKDYIELQQSSKCYMKSSIDMITI
ncbi:hypothetical protein CsatB_015273 [Cannabis sativa]